MILMPPTKRSRNYSLPSIQEVEKGKFMVNLLMYNEEMQKKQLKFLTDTVLKFYVIIITLSYFNIS